MTPVVVGVPIMGDAARRRVELGPIALPTLMGEIKETLGDQLESVGAGVVAGERRPRPFNVRIPIHGDRADGDRFEAGLRLRRQVRALMENSQARLQGLYLAFDPDLELNGWLLVGGGDLSYSQGGISLADFQLELTDCYRIAGARTHRPARRMIAVDRRLATTARDILGTRFSSDFAAAPATVRHYLPVGISDAVRGSTRSPIATTAVASRDGALAMVEGMPDGEIIDFEQAETDQNAAIVRVYDRHGSSTETDWETVYGPDQPLTGIPVLDNAVCRVIPDAGGQLDVQSWTGSARVTDATVTQPTGTTGYSGELVEWTTERAVLKITSAAGTARVEMYVTLQRGWSAPRIEAYAINQSLIAQAITIGVIAKSAGDATVQRPSGTVAVTPAASIGTFAGLAPWALLLGPGTDRAVHLAVLQADVNLRGTILAGREGVLLEHDDYVSVTLGLGPRAAGAANAALLGQTNLIEARCVPEVVAR